MDQLKHAGGPSGSSQLFTAVESVRDILTSSQDDAIIAKLRPLDIDHASHVAECLSGTRQVILDSIYAWAADVAVSNILWIKGHPGVGKSAISTSLLEKWRSSGRLGSSFFFRREQANNMTAGALWCTVAYDLDCRYPNIRKGILAALNANEKPPQHEEYTYVVQPAYRGPATSQ